MEKKRFYKGIQYYHSAKSHFQLYLVRGIKSWRGRYFSARNPFFENPDQYLKKRKQNFRKCNKIQDMEHNFRKVTKIQ